MMFRIIFCITSLITISWFCTYMHPTSAFIDVPPSDLTTKQLACAEHWLYTVVPRHRSQIRWYDIGRWCCWAFFGNDDDGIFGEGNKAHYKPEEPPSLKLALQWFFRNPFHNSCFYVWGNASNHSSELILIAIESNGMHLPRFSWKGTTIFLATTPSYVFGLHDFKPFSALRLKIHEGAECLLYAGWRERGNFGIKIQMYHRISAPTEYSPCVKETELSYFGQLNNQQNWHSFYY